MKKIINLYKKIALFFKKSITITITKQIETEFLSDYNCPENYIKFKLRKHIFDEIPISDFKYEVIKNNDNNKEIRKLSLTYKVLKKRRRLN